jgi:hypothetical protein
MRYNIILYYIILYYIYKRLQVKGKGKMHTFFLCDPAAAAAVAAAAVADSDSAASAAATEGMWREGDAAAYSQVVYVYNHLIMLHIYIIIWREGDAAAYSQVKYIIILREGDAAAHSQASAKII